MKVTNKTKHDALFAAITARWGDENRLLRHLTMRFGFQGYSAEAVMITRSGHQYRSEVGLNVDFGLIQSLIDLMKWQHVDFATEPYPTQSYQDEFDMHDWKFVESLEEEIENEDQPRPAGSPEEYMQRQIEINKRQFLLLWDADHASGRLTTADSQNIQVSKPESPKRRMSRPRAQRTV